MKCMNGSWPQYSEIVAIFNKITEIDLAPSGT